MGGGVAAQQALMLSCSLTNSGLCPDVPPLLTEQTLLQSDTPDAEKESESAGEPAVTVDDGFNYEGWGRGCGEGSF